MDPDALWSDIKYLDNEVRLGNDTDYNRRKCVEKLGELIDWLDNDGFPPSELRE